MEDRSFIVVDANLVVKNQDFDSEMKFNRWSVAELQDRRRGVLMEKNVLNPLKALVHVPRSRVASPFGLSGV